MRRKGSRRALECSHPACAPSRGSPGRSLSSTPSNKRDYFLIVDHRDYFLIEDCIERRSHRLGWRLQWNISNTGGNNAVPESDGYLVAWMHVASALGAGAIQCNGAGLAQFLRDRPARRQPAQLEEYVDSQDSIRLPLSMLPSSDLVHFPPASRLARLGRTDRLPARPMSGSKPPMEIDTSVTTNLLGVRLVRFRCALIVFRLDKDVGLLS